MFAEVGQFSLQSASSYLVHETNYEDCIFHQLNLYLSKNTLEVNVLSNVLSECQK